MKCCKDCKHFTDGHYSKTYISPTCTQRGTDSAAYMRQYVCGVDEARLYEPKIDEISTLTNPEGSQHNDRPKTKAEKGYAG